MKKEWVFSAHYAQTEDGRWDCRLAAKLPQGRTQVNGNGIDPEAAMGDAISKLTETYGYRQFFPFGGDSR